VIVIPAVDIRGGKTVRLVEGREDAETIFGDKPADWARRWVREGAEWLHVVDLDGAFQGAPRNLPAVREIAETAGVPVEFGGGVRDMSVVHALVAAGVARIIIGSRAVDDPAWTAQVFKAFPGKIAVGIDAVNGKVAIHGWKTVTNTDAAELAQSCEKAGASAVIYTDISRDGKMLGPNVPAMRAMIQAVSIPVIASGGVTTIADLKRLAAAGAHATIIGRALYEGRIDLPKAIAAVR